MTTHDVRSLSAPLRAPADTLSGGASLPAAKPLNPNFSSGPCAKFPGWSVDKLVGAATGRSHRAKGPKAKLKAVIDRSKTLLGLPDDWVVGIVPGSDTGAVEMALWSMLGARPTTVLEWEAFSKDWATDATKQLDLTDVSVVKAPYGSLPDLASLPDDHDLVFPFNGTTSGVRLPNLDWIKDDRQGLTICDATSAAFAMEMDYSKLDVLTWSWQKVLGSEGAHGMLALSPRAVDRLETFAPKRALPKLFRLTKNGKLNKGIFEGATINTPSMLAVEDVLIALDWAEDLGGLSALIGRAEANFNVIDAWVQNTSWIDWLPEEAATRSTTSMCLKITHPDFVKLEADAQAAFCKALVQRIEAQDAGYDFNGYRDAPAGLRIWGGGTVEASDLQALLPWIDWSFAIQANETFSQK